MLRPATALCIGLALALAGCGGDDGGDSKKARGLDARLFDTAADDVYAGPAGVYALDSSELTRIDGDGDADGSPIGVAATQPRVAIGNDAAWVTDVTEHDAKRVDLATGDRQVLDMGAVEPVWVAASDDRAWISSGPELVPFTDDGQPGSPVTLPCSISELVFGNGAVWGGCEQGVVRVDADTGEAQLIDVGGEPDALAATESALWALVGDRLVSISAAGDVAVEVAAPGNATSIAGAGTSLWVTADREGDDQPERVTRHDATTGRRVDGPIALPGGTDDVAAASASIAADGDSLWFALAFYGGPLGTVARV